MKKLVGSVKAAIKLAEFIVFFFVFLFGSIIGNWVVSLLGLEGSDPVTQGIILVIPIAIIYLIWKKWGEKAAASV